MHHLILILKLIKLELFQKTNPFQRDLLYFISLQIQTCARFADISDQTGYGGYAVHCLMYFAGITVCMCLPNGILTCLQRGHVRKSHGIYGSAFSDCMASHLCYSCVLLQMSEQVKYNKPRNNSIERV